jgi:epoxyqueuosine reductase QueG
MFDRDVLKADFSIRYAAYLAGLGQYDLSQNIITHKFGPRVRFMAIMTTLFSRRKNIPPWELLTDKC